MAHSKVGDTSIDMAFNILRRRQWVGLIAFAAMLSLAAPFSVFLPDIYRGTATMIVESQETASTFVKASVPELDTRLVTIQQELLSRARLSNLIDSLNLYAPLRGKVSRDALIDRMRRDIHVEFTGTDQNRGRPTTIGMKITYIGLDPNSAASVPNALATQYVQENTKMRERQTGQMAQFLEGQVKAAAEELQRRAQAVDAFKKSHAGELPDQVSINLVTLDHLNSELRFNSENQAKVHERVDRLAERVPGTDAPDEVTTLRNRLRDLRAKYTDKHPEVIQAKAQLEEMEAQRASNGPIASSRKVAKPDHGADAELSALRSEEQTLRSQIATYEQRIHMAPQHEQEGQKLENDYKTAKDSYDSLRSRYDEARLAENLEQTRKAESFRILDTAVIPTMPAAPNRLRLWILAGFLAVASALGTIFLTEHVDTSFHSVGELRLFTTVPVLATIPYIKVHTNFFSQALRVALFAGAVLCACVVLALAAHHAARGNTQLVWLLAGPQV